MTYVVSLAHELAVVPLEPLALPALAFLAYLVFTRVLRSRIPLRPIRITVLALDTVAFPVFFTALNTAISGLSTHPLAFRALRSLVQAALIFAIASLLNRYLNQFVWIHRFRQMRGHEAPRILRNLVAVLIYLLAVGATAVFVFERTAGGVLVSTGVVVGIVGFALQNLIADLFSGIALTIERPFSKGDWIQLPDGTEGAVVDINWQSTHLRSLHHGLYVVPNSVVTRSTVHNTSRPSQAYATWVTISVDRAYPPDIVRRLLLEAALSCDAVLRDPAPVVNISDAGENPLRYAVYVYFKDYPAHFAGRTELFSGIYAHLERSGIYAAGKKYEIATERAAVREVHRPTIEEELREVEIFGILSDEQIGVIAERSRERTCYPGEVIVREGSGDTSLMVVTSGVVRVTKRRDAGKSVEVARLGAGEFFGEMSLLTGEPRSATVSALVQCALIEVPKAALEPIVRDVPELSQKFGEIMVERQLSSAQFIESMRKSDKTASEFIRDYIDRFVQRLLTFFRV